jgi:CRP-like cAMP-binding protein
MDSRNRKITKHFFNRAFPAAALLGDLSPEAEKSLAGIKQSVIYAKDETVFRSGELPRFIYVLRIGKAALLSAGDIYPVGKNEFLGLPEAISNLPYEFELKTLAPSRFETISRADFLFFLQNQSALCFRLLELFGANLQKIYQLLR